MFKVISKTRGELETVYAVRNNGPLLQFLIFNFKGNEWVWVSAYNFVPYCTEPYV